MSDPQEPTYNQLKADIIVLLVWAVLFGVTCSAAFFVGCVVYEHHELAIQEKSVLP